MKDKTGCELLLLRHAKSSWDSPSLTDHERPLNARGRRDAPRMGRLLLSRGLTPDLIVSSSARRALETAQAVAMAAGLERNPRVARTLYHASPATFLDVVRQLPRQARRVLMVGHNPSIENLVELLAGAYHRMPTGALAHFRFGINDWSELREWPDVALLGVWRPKELPDDLDDDTMS